MDKEIWLPVKDYEGLYEVSSFGRVRSLDHHEICKNGFERLRTGRVLKPSLDGRGYFIVSLCKLNKKSTKQVHNLVVVAFFDELYAKKGLCCNHIDGVKTHNYLSNLEIVTYKENSIHAFRIGLSSNAKGEDSVSAKLTEKEVREIRSKYIPKVYTQRMLGKEYGVTRGAIKDILLFKNWKHIR